MYFCPKCNYIFDIAKSYNISNNDNKIVLKKSSDAIKIFETDKHLTNYKAEFTVDELEKNPKFKKMSETDKESFKILFKTNNITHAQFKCNNCNYTREITESILLFQYIVSDNIDKIKSLEENKLICNNPILPRTHDYICKNIMCLSNTNNKIKKEAVFHRDKNTYKINYICCICNHNW